MTAAELNTYVDGIRRSDPFAGLLLRFWQRVLDEPLRFALCLEAVILAIYLPGGLFVSLQNPDLETPIWLDYPGPVFQFAWASLFWAYARQPGLIAASFAAAGSLLNDESLVGRWTARVSTRSIPALFGVVVIAGIVITVFELAPQPDFYHRFYWREPVFFEVFFTPLITLLFYLGMVVSTRQAIAGAILGWGLLRFRPAVPMSHEAAARLVLQIRQIGSSLTRQATPWVILGVWLLAWLIVAMLEDTHNNLILYGTALIYVPGLVLSLIFPLLALTIALRRIRKGQLGLIETQLEKEYGRALETLSDPDRVGDHHNRVRNLQEMIRLTNTYFPVLPVGGVRLQAVAGGAVLQVAVFWLGVLLDVTSVASLAT